jgi:hypothetical protein
MDAPVVSRLFRVVGLCSYWECVNKSVGAPGETGMLQGMQEPCGKGASDSIGERQEVGGRFVIA